MTTNCFRYLRMLLAVLLFSVIILQASPIRVFANSTLTVSQTIANNRAAFKVVDAAASNDAVSILVIQKPTNSVVYADQAVLVNGEFTFETLLPKGEYSGLVSSANNDKVSLEDFTITKEESIVGFRTLNQVAVAKGEAVVLPSSVIAIFDDGANREVGVQWTNVPQTDIAGQYTLTGKVNGTNQTVSLALKVGEGSTGGDNNNNNGNGSTGNQNSSGGNTSTNNNSTPTVNSSTITLMPKLDSQTAAAKAEVTGEVIDDALTHAAADNKGVKTVKISLDPIDGAKAYELILPSSALVEGGSKQLIELHTPVGVIQLPGNMVKSSTAAGSSTMSISIEAVDTYTVADPKLKEAIGVRPVVELNLKIDGKVMDWDNKAAPVQVAVKYNLLSGENPEHLVVWYIDGAGKAVIVPNAKYDEKTETVTFRTSHFSKFAVSYVFKTFEDAGVYPWAQVPIEVLASKGIINGVSETAFHPEEKITRADFLLLLMKTLNLTADFSGNFSDVSQSDYYYEAVGIAKQLGIANGTDGNIFKAKEYISRQDLMVLSARALRIAGVVTNQGSVEHIQNFSDQTEVAAYALEDIAAMVSEGIVSGDGSLLHPRENATRAETAAIMYRIFHKL